MRGDTAKTPNSTGTQRRTTQPSEYPKLAPATVAVKTAAGSRSAAPAMIPGRTLPAFLITEDWSFDGECVSLRAVHRFRDLEAETSLRVSSPFLSTRRKRRDSLCSRRRLLIAFWS